MQAIRFDADVKIKAARKGPATFDVLFYTGGAMEIAGWDRPVVIDLAGLTNGNVLAANLDHDPKQRVGNFTADNDGRRLRGRGMATAATAARDQVVNSARDGYVWQASLEVQPKAVEEVKRGDSVQVNGRTINGPVIVARKGVLKGFAFVTHGADDDTEVAIAAKAKRNSMKTVQSFEEWGSEAVGEEAFGLMTGTQLASMHATFDGRMSATAADHEAVLPLIHASADPVAAEDRRMRQIEIAIRGEWGKYQGEVAELHAAAVRGDKSVDQLVEGMRAVRTKQLEDSYGTGGQIHRGNNRNVSGKVMEAALAQTLGLANAEEGFDDQTLQAAHDQYHGRMGLQQLLIAAADANGYRMQPGERLSQGNLREVLSYAFPPIHAGQGYTTFSVPGILSNVGNKSLLAGWVDGDQSWQKVAQVKPVSDFKQATSYRMLDDLEYEEVGPGGELVHGELSEGSYTRQAKTYGKMVAITRTHIINDDLGAFDDLRVRIGRGGINKFNNVLWAKFLNNTDNFFHSDNANVSTGSPGSVLGTDGVGLQAAVLKFRKLLSADGKSVDGEPEILVAPPEIEFNAYRLWQSTNLVATGDTDTTVPSANVYGGRYKPLIQRRLSDSTYTGYSTTAWYLLRNPSIAAVVVASFLNGKQTPTVETAQANFNTLGIQIRAYHDFGVDRTTDYLAGIRSAGA